MASGAPTDIEQAVKDFFESYRADFGRQDPEAIARHFAYPGHVATEADQVMMTPIQSRSE